MKNNPIIWGEFADLDVIRVNDAYYMLSSTMHFMPGGAILRSYDLINWEIVTYLYHTLEDTPGQRLEGGLSIYGQGMRSACLRYYKGKFYASFISNDTHRTYLYTALDILGPWEKHYIKGFYYDGSILFDDDGRVYIVYGSTTIYLTELKTDLSGPKLDGLHRILLKDKEQIYVGYEGSHIHKVNGRYYLFVIHWHNSGSHRRIEACFSSDSLEGEFVGGDVLNDDLNYHNAGIAQGGIVDTPDGKWYAMLFQDHGAVGRIPVLVPVHWKNDFPAFGIEGKVPQQIDVRSTNPEHIYEPLVESDDFNYIPDEQGRVHLKKVWQWNHNPNDRLWSLTEKPGAYRIHSGKLCQNVIQAVNTLTQRMVGPACEASVTVDATELKDGDYAGVCALQGNYGLIAVMKEAGNFYLVVITKKSEDAAFFGYPIDIEQGQEHTRIPLKSNKVTLKLHADFVDNKDEAEFYYMDNNEWKKLGITHKLSYTLNHFTGCRFGLFMFSTKVIGGLADFINFKYKCISE